MGCDDVPKYYYPDSTDRDPDPRTVDDDFIDALKMDEFPQPRVSGCIRCGAVVFSREMHIEVCT